MKEVTIKIHDSVKLVATVVLYSSTEEYAAELAEFAESEFSIGCCPAPSSYHTGLRLMYLGILDAHYMQGPVKIVATYK